MNIPPPDFTKFAQGTEFTGKEKNVNGKNYVFFKTEVKMDSDEKNRTIAKLVGRTVLTLGLSLLDKQDRKEWSRAIDGKKVEVVKVESELVPLEIRGKIKSKDNQSPKFNLDQIKNCITITKPKEPENEIASAIEAKAEVIHIDNACNGYSDYLELKNIPEGYKVMISTNGPRAFMLARIDQVDKITKAGAYQPHTLG